MQDGEREPRPLDLGPVPGGAGAPGAEEEEAAPDEVAWQGEDVRFDESQTWASSLMFLPLLGGLEGGSRRQASARPGHPGGERGSR